MIGVIHYGMGNISSVLNAFKFIGAEATILQSPEKMGECDRFVLPGVGAFGQGIQNLKQSGFADAIQHYVGIEKHPLLGICLGMQLLATTGTEFGTHTGLGLIPGIVERLPSNGLRLPHIGWNQTRVLRENPLLPRSPGAPFFHYYVHSYRFIPEDLSVTICTCEYGVEFCAGVERENIYGFQFHPEKSQKSGLTILGNFTQLPVPC